MSHHASAPTIAAVPPRSDRSSRQGPAGGNAREVFADLVATGGNRGAIATPMSDRPAPRAADRRDAGREQRSAQERTDAVRNTIGDRNAREDRAPTSSAASHRTAVADGPHPDETAKADPKSDSPRASTADPAACDAGTAPVTSALTDAGPEAGAAAQPPATPLSVSDSDGPPAGTADLAGKPLSGLSLAAAAGVASSANADGKTSNLQNPDGENVLGHHPDPAAGSRSGAPKPEIGDLGFDLSSGAPVPPNGHAPAAAMGAMAGVGDGSSLTAAALPPGVSGAVGLQSAETPRAAVVPMTGLAVEIAARALEGKRRFEIRLDPPELGRIDVRLDIAPDGQVTSRLVVERAETLDLLRRDALTLERALQSAGLRTDDAGLQFSLRDHPSNRWAGSEVVPRSSLLIVPDEDVAVREAVRRGYGILRGMGRGVDIRV